MLDRYLIVEKKRKYFLLSRYGVFILLPALVVLVRSYSNNYATIEQYIPFLILAYLPIYYIQLRHQTKKYGLKKQQLIEFKKIFNKNKKLYRLLIIIAIIVIIFSIHLLVVNFDMNKGMGLREQGNEEIAKASVLLGEYNSTMNSLEKDWEESMISYKKIIGSVPNENQTQLVDILEKMHKTHISMNELKGKLNESLTFFEHSKSYFREMRNYDYLPRWYKDYSLDKLAVSEYYEVSIKKQQEIHDVRGISRTFTLLYYGGISDVVYGFSEIRKIEDKSSNHSDVKLHLNNSIRYIEEAISKFENSYQVIPLESVREDISRLESIRKTLLELKNDNISIESIPKIDLESNIIQITQELGSWVESETKQSEFWKEYYLDEAKKENEEAEESWKENVK
ncbi:MAG: hypothetical protein RBT05_11795 [Bacteroidales bacterium]|nr:hypothetical protein [Bacteroidales bacterium]